MLCSLLAEKYFVRLLKVGSVPGMQYFILCYFIYIYHYIRDVLTIAAITYKKKAKHNRNSIRLGYTK